MQKVVEYVSYGLFANAIISGVIMMGRLYMMAFGWEPEVFGAGMGLFMSVLFSTMLGAFAWIASKDDSLWR